ncbi:MAG: hypothetical protein HW380_3129 [Magnetococcales bacterium]|nr:hypothetical protein [Magnetococcales bacterium]HIJ84152.1 class I SAM-dependent methyltransferase [Magnetococcales bacterium]
MNDLYSQGRDESMNNFYSSTVHNRINADAELTRQRYRQRISRELSWMGWSSRDIAGKKIFDVGTGWQALTFHEWGAQDVVHRDISSVQVDWLHRETVRRNIENIHSRQGDICSDWGEDGDFDLIFLVGVFHHLRDPQGMLEQALPRLKPGGSLFLRLYRSGTWSRWLTAHLRLMATTLNPAVMEKAFQWQFPLEKEGGFLGNMLDDLFTPIYGAFHPQAFVQSAARMGGDVKVDDSMFHWDFDDRDENFRVLFTQKSQAPFAMDRGGKDRFPCVTPVNQIELSLTDPYAGSVRHLLQRAMGLFSEQKNEIERACRLLTLYRLVRIFNAWSYFTMEKPEPVVSAFSSSLSRKRLESLESILQRWGGGES